MNARQKAKHYKKQLERLSPKYHDIFIDRTSLVHYKSGYQKEPFQYFEDPSLRAFHEEREDRWVKHRLFLDLEEVVTKNIKFDAETGVYSLDIWMEL